MTQSRPHSRSVPSWLVPAAIVTIAAVVIALIVVLQRQDTATTSTPSSTPTPTLTTTESATPTDTERAPQNNSDSPPTTVDRGDAPDLSAAERRDPDDPLASGDVDAPVVLIVFSDYQCPYCAKWSNDTLPAMTPYVDSGDLRIEFRDVNVFGEGSVRGARAAYAAALQDEFESMHNAMFADGMARASTQLTDEALGSLAADIGLDTAHFHADYESAETIEAVARNQQLGIDLGAFSTPSFILNGQPLVGAQPTEVFIDLVDSALHDAQTGG